MAAAIKRGFGLEATMTSGGRGEFTIWVDGGKVFDKGTHGDFPTDEEALAAVRAAQGAG